MPSSSRRIQPAETWHRALLSASVAGVSRGSVPPPSAAFTRPPLDEHSDDSMKPADLKGTRFQGTVTIGKAERREEIEEHQVIDSVRVRFAPSPTGLLHIGGARTAIYNWAFARRRGGSFILRIDDTDLERSTEENTWAILSSLRWLGLDWDEGPEVGGSYGPYFQTGRRAFYEGALDRLKNVGAVYPCFCCVEELARKREVARAAGGLSGYDRTCRSLSASEAAGLQASGRPHVWRLKTPDDRGDIVFTDEVRGKMVFPNDAMDDFVIVRSDATPTYNFATVVDDIEMRISHVIRGDDHLSNTPRQILVFEALGACIPAFAHLSMICGPDGKRLSKRHGATSVEAYRESGYLPEALMNYLALLGWSLDDRTTMVDSATLAANFSLDRVSGNPAVFDPEKLEWMNGVYIREMDAGEFVDRIIPLLIEADFLTVEDAKRYREWLLELAPLISQRVKSLVEIVPMVEFLFLDRIVIEETARAQTLAKEGAERILEAAAETLHALEVFDVETVESALRELPEELGSKPKMVFQTVRVAISGKLVSPPLFESIVLLGRERAVDRIRQAAASSAD